MSNVLRSRAPHSALILLTIAGLASSVVACSKEEEKKVGWTCNAADVPMGEVLRCTQQAATSDGVSSTGTTSDGTTTVGTGGAGGTATDPVSSDGTAGSGTTDGSGTVGGAGGTTGDGSEATGDGTSSTGTGTGGTGGSGPVGGTSDLTTSASGSGGGIISYECFPGDTNPDCPPADAYDGMTSGAGDAQTTTDVTSSVGSGTGTGGGGGTGDGSGTGTGGSGGTSGGTTDGTQGTSDGTSSTGTGTGTGGTGTGGTGTGDTGTGDTGTGGAGGSSGGTQGTSDGTSSTGKGGGNGGGSGGNVEKTNRFPGPDECAWVPDLPYCPAGTGNSSDGSPSMGDSYGGSGSTSGGTTSGGTSGGTGGSSGDGSLPPGQDKKYGGTGDGTSSSGTSGGTTSGGTTSGGTTSGGTTSGGTGDGTGDGTSSGGTTSGGTGDGTGDGTSSGGTAGSSGGASGGTSTSGGPGASDGSSSSGSKKGRHYKCEKDAAGNKTCVSVPNCVPGTNPSNGACADADSGTEVQPPSTGGCWITGGGFIIAPNDVTGAPADGHDNYGGNAKGMKDGRIQGHWNHVDHGTKNHAKGKPEYLVCRRVDEPGPGQPGGKKGFFMNQAYFGGPAEWRDAATGQWASGYWFDVVVKDHGEPGSVPHAKNGYMVDTYHFTIRKMDDPNKQVSGAVVYEVGKGGNNASGGLVGGNIQLHPPNNGHPYTPMALPNWVSFEP